VLTLKSKNSTKPKKDFNLALELDVDKSQTNALHRARERYQQKFVEYKKKRRIMEETIGKGIINFRENKQIAADTAKQE